MYSLTVPIPATPRELREAANGPFPDACPLCMGLGLLYALMFDEDGPRPGWDTCATCKGSGQRP